MSKKVKDAPKNKERKGDETTAQQKEKLAELRNLIVKGDTERWKILDEYTSLYMFMVLNYASTLKINFDKTK
jgi:hypothetical protein